jgi:hypothetical protein
LNTFLKYFSAVVITVILSFSALYAQDIYFCEGVDDDGYAIRESSSFTIPNNGGYLYVLVRLPYAVDCSTVSFEIYRNGDYDNTITMDTNSDWTWFWKQITFYKRGTYKIYVYDCYDEMLTSGTLRIDFE